MHLWLTTFICNCLPCSDEDTSQNVRACSHNLTKAFNFSRTASKVFFSCFLFYFLFYNCVSTLYSVEKSLTFSPDHMWSQKCFHDNSYIIGKSSRGSTHSQLINLNFFERDVFFWWKLKCSAEIHYVHVTNTWTWTWTWTWTILD